MSESEGSFCPALRFKTSSESGLEAEYLLDPFYV